MDWSNVLESFLGTLLAGAILIVPVIYLLKKKLSNSPLGMVMG